MGKIYTKTGDKGKTRLLGGCLVSKSDLRIDAYGSVDELNSVIGIVKTFINQESNLEFLGPVLSQLNKIQNELFVIGGMFACENLSQFPNLPQLKPESALRLEHDIDTMTEVLPELKEFILPGGSQLAAFTHLARTTCRRAERLSVKLYEQNEELEECMVYLNRLSDYFFTLARYLNERMNIEDEVWKK